MIKDITKRRARALTFWEKHSDVATEDAFRVSARTLYRWKRVLRNSGGRVEVLNQKQTTNDYATAHHILNEHGFCLSVSYVGRCITTLKARGVIKDAFTKRYDRTKRKKKLRRTEKTGYELDTVVRFVDGVKTYIFTAISLDSRFSFAFAYRSHSSRVATDFLTKLRIVSPIPVTHLQTDNGSEFAKKFEEACRLLAITHFHTYPRSPKLNAYIEHFNRTLSEEFLVYQRLLMRDDIDVFNEALINYRLWYNTERPHASLGCRSPLRYYVSTLSVWDCQMLWTGTPGRCLQRCLFPCWSA